MDFCDYNLNIISKMTNRRPDIKIKESIDSVIDQWYNNFVAVLNFTAGSEDSGIFFVLTLSQKTYKPYTNFAVEKDENMNIIRIIYGLYFSYENMKLEFSEGRKWSPAPITGTY